MNWGYIAAAVAGGLIALVSALTVQTRTEKAAFRREQRDRQHERETWARGLRYEAHVAFLAEFDSRYSTIQRADDRNSGEVAPDDYLLPAWERYESVRLVCTAFTAVAGESALDALMAFTFRGGPWEEVTYRRDQYLGAVRQEFGLPPVPVMGDV